VCSRLWQNSESNRLISAHKCDCELTHRKSHYKKALKHLLKYLLLQKKEVTQVRLAERVNDDRMIYD